MQNFSILAIAAIEQAEVLSCGLEKRKTALDSQCTFATATSIFSFFLFFG
jgi:hypothetical protein